MAEDLEAFAEGRSIKARRPSLVERTIRWRRQNEKAFSWAITAAFAVIAIATVAALAWNGWRNVSQGKLSLLSDQGLIVGRLINEHGVVIPKITIPTQNPIQLDPGQYELQTWTNGRIGQSSSIMIDRGRELGIKIKTPELGVFPETTVRGMPFKFAAGNGRYDFVLLGKDGISRLDGRTGKELWMTSTAELKSDVSELNGAFEWVWPDSNKVYHRLTPYVLEEFDDINADGIHDVMVTCKQKAAAFVLDGKDGTVLWRYVSNLERSVRNFEGVIREVQLVADIDEDGIDDISAAFFCESPDKKLHRWTTMLSGKTGQEIWRLELPDNSGPPQTVHDRLHKVPFQNRNLIHRNDSLFRSRSGYGRRTNVLPQPWNMVPSSQNSKGVRSGWLVCGKQLVHIDLSNGELIKTNNGQPFDLGFSPILQPQSVMIDGIEHLLFADQVEIADENTATEAICRHILWSTETNSILWQFDASADLTWTSRGVDWPKVVDINGDGIPEILIADEAKLGERIYGDTSCMGSLQALDVRTGKPIWASKTLAKIRSQDRQLFRFTLGPDADFDSLDDIYVISPMVKSGRSLSVFIDILSSKTGKRIRMAGAEMPFAGSVFNAVNLATPFIWGTAPDGSPQIVISTLDLSTIYGVANCTAVVSSLTGKVIYSGPQLQLMADADSDGDGRIDLFMHKSREIANPFDSGQLVSIKSTAPARIRTQGTNYRVVHDLDGDNKQDLLTSNSPDLYKTQKAISTRTGKPIWDFEFPEKSGRLRTINADVNGDGVDDFLGLEQASWASASSFPVAVLVCGKTGTMLWRLKVRASRTLSLDTSTFTSQCADVDGDGELEIVMIYRRQSETSKATPIVLHCINARTGDTKWINQLGEHGVQDLSAWKIHLQKIINSKALQITCPCYMLNSQGGVTAAISSFDGASGQNIWKSIFSNPGKLQSELWRFHMQANQTESNTDPAKTMVRIEVNTVDHSFVVKWNDMATGNQVSSYNGNGLFNTAVKQVGFNCSVELGIPFDIYTNEKTYTGLVVRADRSPSWELLVLDGSAKQAKLVRKIRIPSGTMWNKLGQIQVADCNNDGQVDAIYHFDNKLVALDFVTGKTILQRELPTDQRKLLKVDEQNRLHVLSHSRDATGLKLIDIEDFETQWSITLPKQSSDDFSLTSIESDQVIPEFYLSGTEHFAFVATASDYKGDDPAVLESLSMVPSLATQAISNSSQSDPRLILPPPWKYNELTRWREDGMAWSWLGRLVVIMGVFVLPYTYIKFWIGKSTVSLKTFLLLPLLFAVPYVCLTQPLDPRLASSLPRMQSFGTAANVLMHSLIIVPALVALAYGIVWLFQGHWKWLAYYVFAIVLFMFVVAFVQTNGRYGIPAGCQYNYWDPSTFVLIPYALNCFGLVFIAGWILKPVWRLVTKLFRRKKNTSNAMAVA